MRRTNWKKAVSLFTVIALALLYIPVNNAETVIVYHETFAHDIGAAVQSGGASLTKVTD